MERQTPILRELWSLPSYDVSATRCKVTLTQLRADQHQPSEDPAKHPQDHADADTADCSAEKRAHERPGSAPQQKPNHHSVSVPHPAGLRRFPRRRPSQTSGNNAATTGETCPRRSSLASAHGGTDEYAVRAVPAPPSLDYRREDPRVPLLPRNHRRCFLVLRSGIGGAGVSADGSVVGVSSTGSTIHATSCSAEASLRQNRLSVSACGAACAGGACAGAESTAAEARVRIASACAASMMLRASRSAASKCFRTICSYSRRAPPSTAMRCSSSSSSQRSMSASASWYICACFSEARLKSMNRSRCASATMRCASSWARVRSVSASDSATETTWRQSASSRASRGA